MEIQFIVLDVTYGFQDGVDFTIENDFVFDNETGKYFVEKICEIVNASEYSWKFLKVEKNKPEKYISSDEIHEKIGNGCKAILNVVGGDETSEYKKYGFSTFSLCLPCSAENESEMHSEDGFRISIDTICNYTDILRQIIQGYSS